MKKNLFMIAAAIICLTTMLSSTTIDEGGAIKKYLDCECAAPTGLQNLGSGYINWDDTVVPGTHNEFEYTISGYRSDGFGQCEYFSDGGSTNGYSYFDVLSLAPYGIGTCEGGIFGVRSVCRGDNTYICGYSEWVYVYF